jgi:hypothetical protein
MEPTRRGGPLAGEAGFGATVALRPQGGWSAGLDSTAFLPRLSGYGRFILDFDASGSMAYVYASVHSQTATTAGRQSVGAEASIVLVQRGSSWQIRSYLERPRSPLP